MIETHRDDKCEKKVEIKKFMKVSVTFKMPLTTNRVKQWSDSYISRWSWERHLKTSNWSHSKCQADGGRTRLSKIMVKKGLKSVLLYRGARIYSKYTLTNGDNPRLRCSNSLTKANIDFSFFFFLLRDQPINTHQQQNKTSTILVLLESCLQTCMTYTIAACTVNKLLMMDRRTVRNM